MNIESVYEFLRNTVNECPHLLHASNILTKYKTGKNIDILNDIVVEYQKYLVSNLELMGTSDEVVEKRVELLNQYYDSLRKYEDDRGIRLEDIWKSQSKFRSTILEEFIAILFDSIPQEYQTENLKLGASKAYLNLYFYGKNFKSFITKPEIKINVKDQDFAIFREINVRIDKEKKATKISVPVVALECKTYIDKTMYEGSVATAEKIKIGNPCTMFGIVTETYDISRSVIPAYSRIDQIYVLRKSARRKQESDPENPVYFDVVRQLVYDVKRHLEKEWVDVERKLQQEGLLI